MVEFVTESVYRYLKVKYEDHHIAQMFTPGFAKSRPGGPAARRPGGPAARQPGGPADFPQFFCPAVNPRACTGLHLVWACKIDDNKVEFGYLFNNHLNPFRSFLSLLVVKCKTLSFSVYSSVDRTR